MASDTMKLYHSVSSPNSRRVRIFLAEKGLSIPLVAVDLGKSEQHSEAYRAINPEHIMMPGRVIPVREILGELLLDLNQPVLALSAFEQSQVADPNRFRNVYGAARSAELAGDHEKARQYYAQLLQQIGANATDRGEIRHARTFLAKG